MLAMQNERLRRMSPCSAKEARQHRGWRHAGLVTPEEAAYWVERYEAGATVYEIASEEAATLAAVRKKLKELRGSLKRDE